jgi:hypothetical protein
MLLNQTLRGFSLVQAAAARYRQAQIILDLPASPVVAIDILRQRRGQNQSEGRHE